MLYPDADTTNADWPKRTRDVATPLWRPLPLTAGEWNEDAHPRHPAGSPEGGEFAPAASPGAALSKWQTPGLAERFSYGRGHYAALMALTREKYGTNVVEGWTRPEGYEVPATDVSKAGWQAGVGPGEPQTIPDDDVIQPDWQPKAEALLREMQANHGIPVYSEGFTQGKDPAADLQMDLYVNALIADLPLGVQDMLKREQWNVFIAPRERSFEIDGKRFDEGGHADYRKNALWVVSPNGLQEVLAHETGHAAVLTLASRALADMSAYTTAEGGGQRVTNPALQRFVDATAKEGGVSAYVRAYQGADEKGTGWGTDRFSVQRVNEHGSLITRYVDLPRSVNENFAEMMKAALRGGYEGVSPFERDAGKRVSYISDPVSAMHNIAQSHPETFKAFLPLWDELQKSRHVSIAQVEGRR